MEIQDRRIFERFKVGLKARCLNLKEQKEAEAQMCDISAKGLCFSSSAQFSLHTPMEIYLEIPGSDEPLYARGDVVWSTKGNDGVCRTGVCLEKADLMGVGRVLRSGNQ